MKSVQNLKSFWRSSQNYFVLALGKKKICGFPVSRPYLAFGRRNPDPKLFYWIMLVSVSTYKGNFSLDVEALTKQNGVRLLGKLKKKLKPTYPT
jgi:hypothetical protein